MLKLKEIDTLSKNKIKVIKYNKIPILTITPEQIVIKSNKAQSIQFKNKINTAAKLLNLPLQIKQEKFKWYVIFNKKKLVFKNGIALSQKVVNTRKELEKCCRKYLPDQTELWNLIFDEKHFHNLDLSKDDTSRVAYSPKGVDKNDDRRRLKTTLGKYISKQHGVKITQDIENGITNINLELGKLFPYDINEEFEILRGDQIIEAYQKAVGCPSCMTGKSKTKFIKWYASFPEKIGLLVWKKTQGRAIIWTADNGRILIDRIYAGNTSAANIKYREWAKVNNAEMYYLETRNNKAYITLPITAAKQNIPSLDSFAYSTKVSSSRTKNIILSSAYHGKINDYLCYQYNRVINLSKTKKIKKAKKVVIRGKAIA